MRLQIAYDSKLTNCYIRLPKIPEFEREAPQISPQRRCLAVKLVPRRRTEKPVYVGWSGSYSKEKNVLEIAEIFARLLNLDNGEYINVSIDGNIENTDRVEIEPLSVDDFEILEKNCEFLEEQLLNQISIMYNGLIFPFFIHNIVIKLKVLLDSDDKSFYVPNESEILVQQKMRKKDEEIKKEVGAEVKAEFAYHGIINILNVNNHTIYLPKDLISAGKFMSEGDVVRVEYEVRANDTRDMDYTKYIECTEKNTLENTEKKAKFMVVQPSKELNLNEAYFNTKGCISSSHSITVHKQSQTFLKNYKLNVAAYTNIDLLHNKESLYEVNVVLKYLLSQYFEHTYDTTMVLNEDISVSFDDKKLSDWLKEIKYKCANHTMSRLIKILESNHQDNLIYFKISPPINYTQTPIVVNEGKIDGFIDDVKVHRLSALPESSLQLLFPKKNVFSSFFNLAYEKNLISTLEMTSIIHIREQISTKPLFVLLEGPKAIGKTALIHELFTKIHSQIPFMSLYTIDCGDISYRTTSMDSLSKAKEYLQFILDSVTDGFVVLENIDKLCANSGEDNKESAQGPANPFLQLKNLYFVKFLKSFIRKQAVFNKKVFIATCMSGSAVHPDLRDFDTFYKSSKMTSLSKEVRSQLVQKIIEEVLREKDIKLEIDSSELATLSKLTENYLIIDFYNLHEKLQHQSKSLFSLEFLHDSITDMPLSSLTNIKLTKESAKWSDIGGMFSVKSELKDIVEMPYKYSFLFKNLPIKLNTGVLLYGPPGCGKTYIASAIAGECGLNFISVKGPEILDKYIGSSEQNVRELFEKAQAARPCILFFDEFDSIVPRRGNGSTAVTDRIVNQFLCYLDGVENSREGLYVLAATSRPDIIDPAVLRPGRLDRHLYCGIPEKEEIIDILRVFGEKMNIDPSLDLEALADKCRGFTSADVRGLLNNAQLCSVHEYLDKKKEEIKVAEKEEKALEEEDDINLIMSQDNINKAYRDFVPSLSEKEKTRMHKLFEEFRTGKSVDMTKQKIMQA